MDYSALGKSLPHKFLIVSLVLLVGNPFGLETNLTRYFAYKCKFHSFFTFAVDKIGALHCICLLW